MRFASSKIGALSRDEKSPQWSTWFLGRVNRRVSRPVYSSAVDGHRLTDYPETVDPRLHCDQTSEFVADTFANTQ